MRRLAVVLVLVLFGARVQAVTNSVTLGPWVTLDWQQNVFTMSVKLSEPLESWHHDRCMWQATNVSSGAVVLWDGGAGFMDGWHALESAGALDPDGTGVVPWPIQVVYPWWPLAWQPTTASYLPDGQYSVKLLWCSDWSLGYPYTEVWSRTLYVLNGIWNENGTMALPGTGSAEFVGYPAGVWHIAGYRVPDGLWPTRIPVEWTTDASGHVLAEGVHAGVYKLGCMPDGGGGSVGRQITVTVGGLTRFGVVLDSGGGDTGEGGGEVVDPPDSGGSSGGGVTGDWLTRLFVPSESVLRGLRDRAAALAEWGPFGFISDVRDIFAGGPTAAAVPTIGATTSIAGMSVPVSVNLGAVSGYFGPIRLILACGVWVGFCAFLVHRFFPRQVL